MKIRMAIAGALIGPFVGFIGMFLLCVFGDIPYHGCEVSFLGFATSFALFSGAPLGLVTFTFIGFRVGRRLEENAGQQLAADQKCDSGRRETALPTDEPLLQERPSQR